MAMKCSFSGLSKRIALAVLTSVVILLLFQWLPLLKSLEYNALDSLSKTKKNTRPHPGIVLIAIDDASLQTYGWPLPRICLARAIDTLSACQAKTIVVDLLFDTAHQDIEQDRQLGLSTLKANRVIHTCLLDVYAEKTRGPDGIVSPDFENYAVSVDNQHAISPYQAQSITLPQNAFLPAFQQAGSATFIEDTGGRFRRVPLLIDFEGKCMPALSLQGVRHYLDLLDYPLKIQKSGFGRRLNLSIDLHVPIDEKGQAGLNFCGNINVFPVFSMQDLLEGRIPVNMLQDRLILIGSAATGDKDSFVTPFGTDEPGMVMHATAMSNLLNGQSLVELPVLWQWLLLLVLSLTGFLGFPKKRIHQILFLMIILTSIFVLGWVMLSFFFVWLPAAAMQAALLLSVVVFILFYLTRTEADTETVLPDSIKVDSETTAEPEPQFAALKSLEVFPGDDRLILHDQKGRQIQFKLGPIRMAFFYYLVLAKQACNSVQEQKKWVQKSQVQFKDHAEEATFAVYQEDRTPVTYDQFGESDEALVRKYASEINKIIRKETNSDLALIRTPGHDKRKDGSYYLAAEEIVVHL